MALTNGDVAPKGRTFPPVVLDTTLYDLLAEDSNGSVNESLCNVKPNVDPKYPAAPLNNKYLITSPQLDDKDALAHLQLENTSYLLSFWAGPMEVLFVGAEGFSNDELLSRRGIEQNATEAFKVFREDQRPTVRIFANVEDFIKNFSPNGDKIVRWGFALDFAEKVPSVLHPEQMYKLNSKRWLAECSLKSANDRIIDCEAHCSEHKTTSGLWYFVSTCSECSSAVDSEIGRVRQILSDRKAPFVLKLTQCLGSVGTSLVKDEDEKVELIEYISSVLREGLPRITQDNAHIHPTSLVVSDFIPGETAALNFYVRRDGSVRFCGACHQLSTRGGDGGRQQTALTWSEQDKLEKKYREVLQRIGSVLHDEGYYGPAGADVMQHPDDPTKYVIDLNVRTATSLVLGLLRGHCEQRGFDASLVFECLILKIPRDELEKRFEVEFEQGRIILLGNTKLGKVDMWAYPVVLTGEDQSTVQALSEKILEYEAGGNEEAEDVGGG